MRLPKRFVTLFMLIHAVTPLLQSAEQSQTMTETWAAQIGSANAVHHNDLLDELKALTPLGFYSDRANVVIATKRDGTTEEGYYIQIPSSSYLPTNDAEWTFTTAGNGIWTYARNRNDIDFSQDSTVRSPFYSDIQTEWATVETSELEREQSYGRPRPVDPFRTPYRGPYQWMVSIFDSATAPPYEWMVSIFDSATAPPYEWMVAIVDDAVMAYDRERHREVILLAHQAKAGQQEDNPRPHTDIPIYYDIKGGATLWRQDLLKVSNGSIVSYGFGEFGAEVYWYSHDGTEKTLISEHDIRSFFEMDGRFYGYGGLNHMGYNKGYIVEFILRDDAWGAVETYQSNEAVIAHCHLPNSGVVIATSTQIIRISGDGEYSILISDKRWARNKIHSIVTAPDGYIYFSMNHFVGRFPIRKTLGDYELLELAKSVATRPLQSNE